MRRIRRQRLESALTELFQAEPSGDGYALDVEGVPSFSLLDFLKPYLARKIEYENLSITMPSAITATVTADSSGTMKVSLADPIKVRWGQGIIHATVQCYGFTEYADRYQLALTWAGMVPIPISISKPGR